MSRPHLSPARRMLLPTLVVLALAAGCSGADEPEAPAADESSRTSAPTTATPSSAAPARALTVDELAKALPQPSQVPGGSATTVSCPGDDSCQPDTASVNIDLERPGASAGGQGPDGSFFGTDFAAVFATAHEDEAAAAAYVDELRTVAQRYDGSFDIPFEEDETGRTFTPGEKGTGTMEPTTIEGWSGQSFSRVSVYDGGEGEPDGPYQTAQVNLVRGSATVSVNVVVFDEGRDDETALAIARRVATEYVARLG
jgi:hypothetical protein